MSEPGEMPQFRVFAVSMAMKVALACLVCLALLAAALASSGTLPAQAAGTGFPIIGYAWSDDIGWISLSCTNGGSDGSSICSSRNYGLNIASDGTLSGYAWSDNIGWLSANVADLTGCPSGTCVAQLSGGKLSGWLKALAGGSSGWDGWVSLSGSGYGVTVDDGKTGSGKFSGYGWGDVNVGWTDFSLAQTNFKECTVRTYCSGNDLYQENAACADTKVQTCESSCSAGACQAPTGPTLTVACIDPSKTPDGTEAQFTWTASPGTQSYTVASNDMDEHKVNCPSGWDCAQPPDFAAGVAGNVISYTVPVVPNATYQWWVSALNTVGYSQSNTVTNACQPSCTVTPFCGDDGNVYQTNADCSESQTPIQMCSYGCTVNHCNAPPAAAGILTAQPQIVNPDDTAHNTVSVSWSAVNVNSCTVTGTNGDSWSDNPGTHTSSAIVAQTIYTLSCDAEDGSTFTASTTVNITPNYQEN